MSRFSEIENQVSYEDIFKPFIVPINKINLFKDYLNSIYNYLVKNSDDFNNGINKYTFVKFFNISGIISIRLFTAFKNLDQFDQLKEEILKRNKFDNRYRQIKSKVQLYITEKENPHLVTKNDNYISKEHFINGMLKLYSGSFTDNLQIIFCMYDFDIDGYITEEDVRILLSHIPIKSTKEETYYKFRKEINEYKDILKSHEEIKRIISKTFRTNKCYNIFDYEKTIKNISSDTFVHLLVYLLSQRPFSMKSLFFYECMNKKIDVKGNIVSDLILNKLSIFPPSISNKSLRSKSVIKTPGSKPNSVVRFKSVFESFNENSKIPENHYIKLNKTLSTLSSPKYNNNLNSLNQQQYSKFNSDDKKSNEIDMVDLNKYNYIEEDLKILSEQNKLKIKFKNKNKINGNKEYNEQDNICIVSNNSDRNNVINKVKGMIKLKSKIKRVNDKISNDHNNDYYFNSNNVNNVNNFAKLNKNNNVAELSTKRNDKTLIYEPSIKTCFITEDFIVKNTNFIKKLKLVDSRIILENNFKVSSVIEIKKLINKTNRICDEIQDFNNRRECMNKNLFFGEFWASKDYSFLNVRNTKYKPELFDMLNKTFNKKPISTSKVFKKIFEKYRKKNNSIRNYFDETNEKSKNKDEPIKLVLNEESSKIEIFGNFLDIFFKNCSQDEKNVLESEKVESMEGFLLKKDMKTNDEYHKVYYKLINKDLYCKLFFISFIL